MLFHKKTDDLLYIGQTKQWVTDRLSTHRTKGSRVRKYLDAHNISPRWVEPMEVGWFNTREEALAEEKRLIQEQHPLINKCHNSKAKTIDPVNSNMPCPV